MFAVPVRERRRQATRAEILEAAWAIVHEEGLAALSMRDLGARVGMSAAALYRYFPSKLDIFDALFAQGHEQLQAHLGAGPPEDDPEAAFRRSSHRLMAFCITDPTRYALLFQRTIPGFVPSEGSMDLARQSYRHALEELSALGITDQASIDLWAAIHLGLTAQQVANDPGGDRWARLVDEVVDLFLTHVGVYQPRGGTDAKRSRGNRRGGGGRSATR